MHAVQNPRTFCTKLSARPVNRAASVGKYRRDTDMMPTRYRQGFSLLTRGLCPIRVHWVSLVVNQTNPVSPAR